MQFTDYHTMYSWGQKHGFKAKTMADFNDMYIPMLDERCRQLHGRPISEVDPFTPALLETERLWCEARRPYYNVWPGIIPGLTKLKLDIDAGYFSLPLPELLIRLPVKADHPLKFEYEGKQWALRNVLCANTDLKYSAKKGDPHYIPGFTGQFVKAISYQIDIGECIDGLPDLPVRQYKHILVEPGRSIEWSFTHIPTHESAERGVLYPAWFNEDVARLICTVCLMATDPEIVEPEVLASDEERYSKTRDSALVDKAHRRGKVGWNVGKDIEVVPHYRRACPAALYWTGEGRRFPKIRFRKGSVVHRKRLASVPTGFMGPLETED
jgi:hypothetical protein